MAVKGIERRKVIQHILFIKARYERLIWSTPNLQYESTLLELANMSDKELMNEINRLSDIYGEERVIQPLLRFVTTQNIDEE